MKVCLITPEYPPMQGGVGDYTNHLRRAVSGLGLVPVVVTSNGAKAPSEGVYGVDGWSFSCWGNILEHISKVEPDLLHIQYQTAGYAMHPAINLLPMRLRLMRNRPRVLVTFHDLKVPYLFPKAGSVRRLPSYLLSRYADGVVVTNGEDYSRLCRVASVPGASRSATADCFRSVFVIPIGSNIPNLPPSGFDREAWRRRLGVERGELLLAYFGFLNQSKGVDVLFEAFATLIESGFKARLLMAGGSFGDSDPTNVAYGRRIKAEVNSAGYHSRVIWTGFTSSEDVCANLLASDICVLPFNEGASLRHGTLIAAIVHEMPIITTRPPEPRYDHPALPCLDGAMKLVPPRDVGALAKAIAELGHSESIRDDLSKAIGKIAPAFNWDVIGKAHVEAYDRVLRKPR